MGYNAPCDRRRGLRPRLAGEIDDIDTYVVAKSDLLGCILVRAGLDEAERALIEDANRATPAQVDPPPSR